VVGGSLPNGSDANPYFLAPDVVRRNVNELTAVEVLGAAGICLGLNVNPLLQTSAMRQRREQLQRINNIDPAFLQTLLFYATFGISELFHDPAKLNARLAFSNAGVEYGDAGINARIKRISADPFAAFDLSRHYTPTGAVGNAKVLSMHTSGDGLVLPEQQSELDGKLTTAQWSRSMVRESSATHCGFTDAELISGWDALIAWTRQGATKPDARSLQSRCTALSGAGGSDCRFDANAVFGRYTDRVRTRPKTGRTVDSNVSGLWFDPARNGEGYVVEVLDEQRAVVAFFSYPPTGAAGVQRWAVGVGEIRDNSIIVDALTRSRGARFGQALDPTAVQTIAYGRTQLFFDRCAASQYRMQVADATPDLQGSLTQIAFVGEQRCDRQYFAPPSTTRGGLSGAWFDPARGGEGVFLTELDDNRIAVQWFTFDENAEQRWLSGLALRIGNRLVVDLVEPVGTRYGTAFQTSAIQQRPFGRLTLTFSNCNNARFDFIPTRAGIDSVNMPLQRLTTLRNMTGCQLQ
jgi:hypothetical protein